VRVLHGVGERLGDHLLQVLDRVRGRSALGCVRPAGRRGSRFEPLRSLRAAASNRLDHAVAALLVEHATEDGDSECTSQLAASLTAEAMPCFVSGNDSVMAVLEGVPGSALPAANSRRPIAECA